MPEKPSQAAVEDLIEALKACMEDLQYQLDQNDSIRGCTALSMGRSALSAVKGADDGD